MNERDIFQAAVEIENPAERASFLDEACEGQPGLKSNVLALLKHYEDASSFLERPPAELGQARLSDEHATDEHSPAATDATGLPMNDETLKSYLSPSETPGVLGRLGPYEILEKIGQGGMGLVLKAKDTKLERIVAIKLLAPEFASNPMARTRFLREAQAAAAVTHDHVVRIYAVNDRPQRPMLVMECIEGQSLQQKIDRTGALEVKEILRIGYQAALGLAAAHKQGLVHRDIKPSNILLENGIERVKITDFGLARAVDDIGITKTGQITGTPQYMSPEQAQGDQVDSRSDLFSLGSVMYAMCTGRAAFRAESTVAVLRRVCDDDPRPIPQINPEIPPALVDIVEQLMEKNPDDRIQSAEEVAELLSELLTQIQQPGSTLCVSWPRPRKAAPIASPVPEREPSFGEVLAYIGVIDFLVFLVVFVVEAGLNGLWKLLGLPIYSRDLETYVVPLCVGLGFVLIGGLIAEATGKTQVLPTFDRWLKNKVGPAGKVYLGLATVLLGLCISEATGVTQLASTIIRVVAGEGTLVVEVDDPNVSVTIEGQDIVITGAAPNEVRLKPGQYRLTATKDGAPLRQELVTISRNGKSVVRISSRRSF